jgi:hypothetical protein
VADKPLDHRRALQILSSAQVFCPSVVPGLGGGGYYVFSGMKVLGHGATIEAALDAARAAGYMPDVPPLPPYRADGKNVLRRGEVLITCSSYTLASRVANALNVYNPNERGI